MLTKKTVVIDLMLGYKCNFNCKYCFQKRNTVIYADDITEEVLNKVADIAKKLTQKYKVRFAIFGGEPLLYMEKIELLILLLKDNKDIDFAICTNGSLISNHTNKILYLKKILNSNKTNRRFHFVVSYDYNLQDNRCPNTYKLVRDNIKWLCDNDFFVCTNTVFDVDYKENIYNCFLDFIKLNLECPHLIMKFNFNYFLKNINYNEIELENIFKKCNFIIKKANLEKNIRYNNITAKEINFVKRLDTCIHSDLYFGIDSNGNITFGCNSTTVQDNIKQLLYVGNVLNNTLEEIESNKQNLLNKINYSIDKKCKKCENVCKIWPWFKENFSLETFMSPLHNKQCLIQKYITEYLIF